MLRLLAGRNAHDRVFLVRRRLEIYLDHDSAIRRCGPRRFVATKLQLRPSQLPNAAVHRPLLPPVYGASDERCSRSTSRDYTPQGGGQRCVDIRDLERFRAPGCTAAHASPTCTTLSAGALDIRNGNYNLCVVLVGTIAFLADQLHQRRADC